MQETLRLLKGLQELDSDLFKIRDELRRLPLERDARRAAIDQRLETLKGYDMRLHETQQRVKEIEDMTTMQRQRIRKLEGEAANTADTALVMAFQHEMRSLKRLISEAEEEGLGLVEKMSALSAEREALAAQVAEAEADFLEFSANVDQEIAAAEEKRAGMDAERATRMGQALTPEILTSYEELIDAREGQAMAELDGRICQGCYVNVPNNIYVRLARGMEIVKCPSCGRILYLAEL